ncbi:hypothetical protein AB1N83_010115 [Pleurotus pulmonarius]
MYERKIDLISDSTMASAKGVGRRAEGVRGFGQTIHFWRGGRLTQRPSSILTKLVVNRLCTACTPKSLDVYGQPFTSISQARWAAYDGNRGGVARVFFCRVAMPDSMDQLIRDVSTRTSNDTSHREPSSADSSSTLAVDLVSSGGTTRPEYACLAHGDSGADLFERLVKAGVIKRAKVVVSGQGIGPPASSRSFLERDATTPYAHTNSRSHTL